MFYQMKAVFCITVLVFGMLVAPFSTFAEMKVLPTDKGTVKVGISTIPEKPAPGTIKLKIDFLNPQTGAIQDHIDYVVTVTKDGKAVFGPIPLTHTSIGTVTIPVEIKEKGEYKITVDVEGVLFIPTSEKATFSVMVGQAEHNAISDQPSTKPSSPTKSPEAKMPDSGKSANSGSTGKAIIKADKTKKTDTKTTKTDTKTDSTAKKTNTAAKKTDSKSVKKTIPKQNTKQ